MYRTFKWYLLNPMLIKTKDKIEIDFMLYFREGLFLLCPEGVIKLNI